MYTPAIDQQMLARMVEACQTQKLVPFLGAGMSFDRLHLWDGFVEALEKESGTATESPDPAARAEKPVAVLRSVHGAKFPDYVQKALQNKAGEAVPAQTAALAKIAWPLTLTTNYDDLFLDAWLEEEARRKEKEAKTYRKPHVDIQHWEYPIVLGRSPKDCFRVLNSLRAPDQPIIWALQGFLGWQTATESLPAPSNRDELRNQLVVGHREYRRVTHREPHFRRAFSEVFRERSFLFLGSGLSDPYLLDLFSEIVELYGPSPRPHFVMTPGDKFPVDWYRESFGIHVVKLNGWADLPVVLTGIGEQVESKNSQRKRFEFTIDTRGGGQVELAIERGPLADPSPSRLGECLVYSAGGSAASSDTLRISSRGEDQMKRLELWDKRCFERISDRLVKIHSSGRDRNTDRQRTSLIILAAIARASTSSDGEGDERDDTAFRDARILAELFEEILRYADKNACRYVRTMLLAAGARATFPRYVALQELVRGFRDWAAERKQGTVERVTINTEDEAVWSGVGSGRLDILELLNCSDTRYWVEVVGYDGWAQQSLRLEPGTTTLATVFDAVGLKNPDHLVSVYPPVGEGEKPRTRREIGKLTLSAFGVLPGSTLRIEPPCTPPAHPMRAQTPQERRTRQG
jgi:hypothetical protein